MTSPTIPVQPVDAAKVIKEWLKSELAVSFPTLMVRLELPIDWQPGHPPVLCVFNDGGPVNQWPVATSPTIRVTTWTTGRDITYIHRALGLMLCTPIVGIAKVLPGTGVIESRDSKNNGDVASFTVRTRVRTTAVI